MRAQLSFWHRLLVGLFFLAILPGWGGDKAAAANTQPMTVSCNGNEIFNNAEWVVTSQGSSIPEDPFQVMVDGNVCGATKLLTFARRVADTTLFPQVFVVNSSGFLRIKAGADPTPPIPFGQSLVLGPAVFGTSGSFPNTTLFFNPQLQTVSIDTSRLNPDGTGDLHIRLVANDTNLPANATKTNQIMNMTWDIRLREPTDVQTQIDVAGQFTFTEDVTLDPVRTSEFQSFRLLQISSLYIDNSSHDVDALRYEGATGSVELSYVPNLAGALLPHIPVPVNLEIPVFESLHTDDLGAPNGNTPSYRITVLQTEGPVTGPITPRAFFVSTTNVNDDNLGAWLHQGPSQPTIRSGTTGRIEYRVVATTNPLPATLTTSISLTGGWNFISLPVQPASKAVGDLLDLLSPNLKVAWSYDNVTKSWQRYRPNDTASSLTSVEQGKGYWVYLTEPATFTVTGINVAPIVPLSEGWNLVGYAGPDGAPLTDGLYGISGNWSLIWGWESGEWSAAWDCSGSPPVPALLYLRQGKAYWFRIKPGMATNWTQ